MAKRFFALFFLFLNFNLATYSQIIPSMEKYDNAWKQVQDFQSKGLPESVVKVVDEIYAMAKAEKNSAQLVKAVVHQLRYLQDKHEDVLIKTIAKVQSEIKQAEFPTKPLLHSMLAEIYWHYYTNNRHRFLGRSETINFEETNPETWSLKKIISETLDHYLHSLENPQLSQAEKVDVFLPVLNTGNDMGRNYRPTLFDFLAHRALDFLMSQEPDLNKPAYYFTLDKEVYLSPSAEFTQIKIESRDTLSSKLNAMLILQSLEKFHSKDDDPAALVDVVLKRFKFVKNSLALSNKNDLYFQALDRLESQFQSNPVVGFITREKGNLLVETGAMYIPLQSDKYKWDVKQAYALCGEAIKRFPDSDGAIHCENLQEDILSKSLTATIEENNTPDQPFRALISYKNFTSFHYRIVKTTRAEVRELRKKLEAEYLKDYNVDKEKSFIEFFVGKRPLKTGYYTLPDDGDYQQHRIEVKLEAVPVGEYIILFSESSGFAVDKNVVAYSTTVVSNIAYIYRSAKSGENEFYILHRETGKPLSGVTITTFTYEYSNLKNAYQPVKLGTYKTNTQGYTKIPFSKSERRRSFFAEFRKDDDMNSMESIDKEYYYLDHSIHQYQYGELNSHPSTIFFLDRAIYRPGQTIYFKGLAIVTNGKKPEIQPNKTITVSLFDVNYQERATQTFRTNEYGTFSGTFIAPESGLLGEMYLRTVDQSGSISFAVEEYKRPKFEVKFEPVKGTFRLDNKIQVTGTAQAYSGANIDGAKVVYRVVRQAEFPFWWWCFRGYYPNSPDVEIVHGETITDTDGKFTFEFKALPDKTVDPDSDPRFNYRFYADVTDINGETHSANSFVIVSQKALKVGVDISDINRETSKEKFTISSTNMAGEFEPAEGLIKVYSLTAPTRAFRNRLWTQPDRQLYTREEYYKYFPHDLFDDESNRYKWEREKEILSLPFNTANSKELSISNLHQWNDGYYVLEISSKDKFGQAVKEVNYFSVFSPLSKKLSVPEIDYYQFLVAGAEPGDNASFLAGTSDAHVNALYEIEKDGNILSSEWLTLKNQQRYFEIPIKEEYRGNIAVHYVFVRNNRLYTHSSTVSVPYSNKQLNLSFETFRDKLKPGEEEEWRIKIAGPNADKAIAEMVATLYDESLDEFRSNSWYAGFYSYSYSALGWKSDFGFSSMNFKIYNRYWNSSHSRSAWTPSFDYLNWFGYNFYYGRSYDQRMPRNAASRSINNQGDFEEEIQVSLSAEIQSDAKVSYGYNVSQKFEDDAQNLQKPEVDMSVVKVRKNFNETAFFYPHLITNAEGEVILKFTIPEALTRWKMLGFAHTKDLQSGMLSNHLVTQKELMVAPNQPRFFREGDRMFFSAKITSLTYRELQGDARLEFFDALTMKPVNDALKNLQPNKSFTIKAKQSTSLEWSIEIPETVQALTYRIVAKAGEFSDGEEMTLPVVTNRMLVTETLPLTIRGKQSKEFKFHKLLNNKSSTLKHQRYTLEFTSNPAWYAIQALPYMMEYPYDCVEQSFSKYYANVIASHVANSNPRIKQVFDTWKNYQPDALLSNLEKNQELKSAILEETPWVLEAKDESQRKRNVALLFDLNRMAREEERALDKVIKAQTSSGGFSWFPGFPEDRYMTQHIIAGLGHLVVLNVKPYQKNGQVMKMISSALSYLDNQIKYDYDKLVALSKKKEINLEDDNISDIHFHYLYVRSFFRSIEVDKNNKEAFDYFLGQAKKYWLDGNIYLEGMACLALHRFGETQVAKNMIKSFSERALHSEEMGMYWKKENGYWWYNAPIETQALMIEVYDEVANDVKSVDDLKVWLLKQKQTQDWKTTKATAEACYALLRKGTDFLSNTALSEIKVGNEIVDPLKSEENKVEAGTGYFKTAWQASEINSSMGKITVDKTDDGPGWGAVYWQYFEQLDKITSSETPLKLKKDLFVQQQADNGLVISPVNDRTSFRIGDLVNVRIELRVDRDMEYVHLKDMRASAFEPISTLSTYKYQDGLWYYESPRDLSMNFFIGWLSKGTYVFEYSLRVSQKGNFSNGITTIQCMYAPEFSSQSQGIRVDVK